jgi:hypothetical protein
MKKFFLICLCTWVSQTLYSQISSSKQEETQRYLNTLNTSTKTLVINLSGFSLNYIGEFKTELTGWHEKIISVNLNENTQVISIVHNELLDPREISDVLSKYQIVKDRIISHQ